MFLGMTVMSIYDKPTDSIRIGDFLFAIVGIGTTYVGLQVANNGVKGKYYREELSEKESETK